MNGVISQQTQTILNLQVRCLLGSETGNGFYLSEEDAPTIYFSFLPAFAAGLKEKEKGIVFVGGNFVVGLIGTPNEGLYEALHAKLSEGGKVKAQKKNAVSFKNKEVKKSKPVKTSDILSFSMIRDKINRDDVVQILQEHDFEALT